MSLSRIRDWLTLADYELAKDRATRQVVGRYARGNISAQNGSYIDDRELAGLSALGDNASSKLKKSAS